MPDNFILATDSYKLTHWNQYPEDTNGVYSYLEAREGAKYPSTLFFGLQSILRELEASVVTIPMIKQAEALSNLHFAGTAKFNREGWKRIVQKHGGALPLRIKAVPEGTVVPVGNVLMTIENTDPSLPWLTNYVESLLLHVWYPTTVATKSYYARNRMRGYLRTSSDNLAALDFMLHDFGYRGATSHESAAIGGAGHLINFLGTDNVPALELLMRDYFGDPTTLGFSVPATEHSVMTACGRAGEQGIVKKLIRDYPTGILSVVADSFDIFRFQAMMGGVFKEAIMARDGKFVMRPDSVPDGYTPATLITSLLHHLWADFGGTVNSKGFKVLDPHVGMIWGDGIDEDDIDEILLEMITEGFSAENVAFGMGGGLLQRVDRDTQRFAIKSAAQKRNGAWLDVSKSTPGGKSSKGGRMKLIERDGEYATVREDADGYDVLQKVFEDGMMYNETTFDAVRSRVR